ncbi:hypothetical protein [Rhodanobacter sp. C01]|uniref:hypothetical protein n=1 Tax=Rhodanobacter sp. C01 TaxID=1945856 RepID=UPI0011158905|nr:hypothetical protein [Rhodanobacter sp. C01]
MSRTTMPTRLTSSLILSLALITSACGSSMKTPDIKQNPHPKMRYEITMTIDGAPGPFDSVTAFVQYKVSNDRCVPLQPISGATLAPEDSVPLDLTKISDKVYTGHLYVDLLQDEDYYGLGVCHWEVVAATAVLQVKNVGFSPGLFKADVLAQRSATRYFLERDYFDAHAGKENMFPSDPGESSPSVYKAEFQGHLFSATLVAKEDFL